jgi:CO/xanthine dehydrogenase Mo-binding subunit
MSRTEVFLGTGPTSGSYVKLKMGVTKDGRITAAEAMLAYEAGGFPGSIVNCGGLCIFAPYHIENVLIDMYDVVVNKPKTAAYRAPGAPNAELATECMIDEFCEKLKIDPLEFRLKNAAKEGDCNRTEFCTPRLVSSDCRSCPPIRTLSLETGDPVGGSRVASVTGSAGWHQCYGASQWRWHGHDRRLH